MAMIEFGGEVRFKEGNVVNFQTLAKEIFGDKLVSIRVEASMDNGTDILNYVYGSFSALDVEANILFEQFLHNLQVQTWGTAIYDLKSTVRWKN